ncbi:hypothetical protein LCGC14_1488880 [marine sediment metagenome]|uniref:Uncharacterized protein n=1 Tax=marine sediment metagenome TaxID=412755 RepID=A0A0F9J7C0_9ZZZZ
MPSRTLHNLMNAMLLGFSANDLHKFMDRASRTMRQKHREVGHDLTALTQMIFMFKHKYSIMDIFKAYLLHKALDGSMSGLQAAVKSKNKGYGRKDNTMEIINKLKKEMFRI